MIVEDERGQEMNYDYHVARNQPVAVVERYLEFEAFVQRYMKIKDKNAHQSLTRDLMENIWQRYGNDM